MIRRSSMLEVLYSGRAKAYERVVQDMPDIPDMNLLMAFTSSFFFTTPRVPHASSQRLAPKSMKHVGCF